MRIALPNYDVLPVWMELWTALSGSLCTPLQFVPASQWHDADDNATFVDQFVRSAVVDATLDVWNVNQFQDARGVKTSAAVLWSAEGFKIPNSTVVEPNSLRQTLLPLFLLSVFSTDFWLMLAAFVLLFSAVNGVAGRLLRRALCWRWLQHWLGQDTHYSTLGTTGGARLYLLLTAIFAIHSLNLYQGCMLSYLVQPRPYTPPFSDVDDVTALIACGRAKLDLETPDWHTTLDGQMSSEQQRRWQQALSDNPPIYSLLEDTSQYGLVIEFGTWWWHVTRSTPHSCSTTFVPTGATLRRAFLVSRHTPDAALVCLNSAIHEHFGLLQSLLERTLRASERRLDWCRQNLINEQTPVAGDAIRLGRLSGWFAVFVVGLAVAASVFLLEQCARLHKHYWAVVTWHY